MPEIEDTEADEEEELPLNPPSKERMIHRAFCLSAVVCRSFIDEANNDHCTQVQAAMKSWLEDVRAEQELELWEADCINTPTGSLAPQLRTNASWLSEGLAVLAWALNLLDLPPHDECVDPKQVTDAAAFLQPDAQSLLQRAEPREAEEIEQGADRAFAIHWRLRQHQLDGRPLNFGEFAKSAWFGPLNIDGIPLAEGDLAIQGQPLTQAPAGLVATALSSARERHQAFNWLLGHEEIYSQVVANT